MAAGLQVWGPAPDHELWVDTNHYLTRVYGNMTLGPGTTTHSLPQLGSQGTPFAAAPSIQPQVQTIGGVAFRAMRIGEVSWTSTTIGITFAYADVVNPTMFIYYGAY